MQPHRLINEINKFVLDLYFRFQFFIGKLDLDKSSCTLLIIRTTRCVCETQRSPIMANSKDGQGHKDKYIDLVTRNIMKALALAVQKLKAGDDLEFLPPGKIGGV